MLNRQTLLGGGALLIAAFVVYWNSFDVPFVFDDGPSIQGNPTIRQLWPLTVPLSPPANGEGVTGRPLVNLSLAINFAIGGFEVRGYHVMNVFLHALAGLALWGIARRTLRSDVMSARVRENAELLAWCMALIWLVHPLLTESVTCVIQRTEVLGGLFFLATIYGFIRATASGSQVWFALTIAACVAGMTSKEIVAGAPVLALLYDRTFISGTFRGAWQRHKKLYLALAATWLWLAWLMLHNQQRGRTVGFGLGVTSWEYLLTQCRALTIYLKLSFWPHPLIVDYGTPVVKSLGDVWWRGVIIVGLLGGTAFALWRRPVIGFVGAWFFVILAPSSSIVPLTTQTIAEHRMYLPLIAVVALAAVGVVHWLGRRGCVGLALIAVASGGATIARNHDYRDDLTLWEGTVAASPHNSRALAGLGTAHFARGNLAEAIRYYAESLELDPDSALKRYNLGLAYGASGQVDEAIACYRAALRIAPQYVPVHANLGALLVDRGAYEEAIPHLRGAILAVATMPDAHYFLGRALTGVGRTEEAMAAYREAIRLDAEQIAARLNLGILLAQAGRMDEARTTLVETVRLKPSLAEAHANLGIVLVELRQPLEAVASYQEALRLSPDYALTHYNLGNALIQLQRWSEAKKHFQEAVRLRPDLDAARQMLEQMREVP
ncbi:tetratricopeptide repeat protein [Oleiharenicola lentus]|uniref:tetratricopeptide repeat protein n=1 Tax=Oleiharenicola lentus TaxID=2508720 RepID=UPI003F66D481